MKYKAVLMAPDGDWVTDYYGCSTKEEVWDNIENQGSRWIFYPFPFVVVDREKGYTTKTQRVVDLPYRWPRPSHKGKTIEYIGDWMREHPDTIYAMLEY